MKKKSRKGYTLIELVIYLVIASILFALSAWGISSWINYSAFKKSNETAQALFLSAQRKLAVMYSEGTLPELQNDLIGESLMTNVTEYGVSSDEYNSRLCYIISNRTSYSPTAAGKWFDKIFESAGYDPTLYSEGLIAIEFDPFDGIVYSVFYSDSAKNTSFSYNDEDYKLNKKGNLSIVDRSYSYRKERLIGYYSSDMLSSVPYSSKIKMGSVELVNDEMLYLKWNVASLSSSSLIGKLQYNIDIYSPTDSTALLTITTLSEITAEGGKILCQVENADKTKSAQMYFYAFIGEDGYLHLVLDAADISAALTRYDLTAQAFSNEEFLATSSIARLYPFGLPIASDFYVKLYALSGGNVSSSIITSNASNSMMASFKPEDGAQNSSYSLTKGRHLFNIRFIESTTGTNPADYNIDSDITWGEKCFEQLDSSVFDTLEDIVIQPDFVPIYSLREDSVLNGNDYRLISFRINTPLISPEGEEVESLGLFCSNYGDIKELSFSLFSGKALQRASNVALGPIGALCGTNYARIEKVVILSGSVSGEDYVGGICGRMVSDRQKAQINECTNCAAVTGDRFVGGIVGFAADSDRGMNINSCKNFAQIVLEKEKSCFAGGIVGYLGENASCVSCQSSQNAQASSVKGFTKGCFVGGIAGLSRGSLRLCSTISKNYTNRNITSYVIGNKYVGGITGASITNEGLSQGPLNNSSHVIGLSYVGGITSVNAEMVFDKDITQKSFDPIEDVSINLTYSPDIELSAWTNTGIVSARDEYCGGITALNCGRIIGCASRINVSASMLSVASSYYDSAMGVGGIAGINYGQVISANSSERLSSSAVLSGENFVGGLIGINMPQGVLSSVELSGGYIKGNDFVGGLIGLNLSAQTLDGAELCARPNSISGNCYVGGLIGGIIINPDKQISTKASVDNFLGRISASGYFTGGLFGYIQLVRNNAQQCAESLLTENADTASVILQRISNAASYGQSAYSLTLEGSDGADVLSSVTGSMHIGGVVGYTHSDTSLTITNYTLGVSSINATKAYSDSALGEKVDERDNPVSVKYSFVGAVTGCAERNVTISYCSSSLSSAVRSAGTYMSGMVEVNKGEISHCTSAGNYHSSSSYVSAFAGLNCSGGIISFCTMNGQVRGLSYVGGVAVRNEGIINSCTVGQNDSQAVYASGSVIGGIVSINAPGGVLSSNALKKNVNYDSGCIESTIVGGIAAKNYSNITSSNIIEASIGATSDAAGIVAINYSSVGSAASPYAVCSANVYSSLGNAGGITCSNEAGATVSFWRFNGEVSSVKGLSGGVTAVNLGTITSCEAYGLVESSENISGGIAAKNESLISGSSVFARVYGYGLIGGITAENKGRIASCSYGFGSSLNSSGVITEGIYIGGIAGVNREGAEIAKCGGVLSQGNYPSISDEAYGSVVGGIAGLNEHGASITGSEVILGTDTNTAQRASASFKSYIDIRKTSAAGNCGGIAGNNLGIISGMSQVGSISSYASEASGSCGGIAGANGYSYKDDEGELHVIIGQIKNCFYSGSLSQSSASVVSRYSSLGGITGINYESSLIDSCTIGTSLNTSVTGSNTFTSGIAATNLGEVIRCYADNSSSGKNVNVTLNLGSTRGMLGGLIGKNEASGIISYSSTASNWSVSRANTSSTIYIGGIVGLTEGGRYLSHLTNRARVSSSGSHLGGIIGAIKPLDSDLNGSGFVFDNLVNYGNISAGSGIMGGIVGYWQSMGGDLYYCDNHGSLNSSSYRVGEIVGYIYVSRAVKECFGIYECERASSTAAVGYDENPGGHDLRSCFNNSDYRSSSRGDYSSSNVLTISSVDFANSRYSLNYSFSTVTNKNRTKYVEVTVMFKAPGAASYSPYVVRYIDNDLTKVDFALPYEWEDGTEFYFSLRALNGNNNNYSATVSSARVTYTNALYEPQVRFVVLGENNYLPYGYFKVENAGDLDRLCGAGNWHVDVKISAGGNGSSRIGGQVENGASVDYSSNILSLTSNNGGATFVSQAVSDVSGFADSGTLSNTVRARSFSGSPEITLNSLKFNGTDEDSLTLNFNVMISDVWASHLVYRAELIDKSGTLYAESNFVVPARTDYSVPSVQIAMTIPGENVEKIAGKSLYFRYYLWEDEAMLHFHSERNAGAKVYNGTFLDSSEFYSPCLALGILGGGGTNASAKYYRVNVTAPPQIKAPVISKTYTVDNDARSYVFSWSDDSGIDMANASYTAVLTGTDIISGAQDTIAQLSPTSTNTWSVAGELASRYTDITLKVTRLGREYSAGTILYIASSNQESFELSEPLPTPFAPSFELVDKNDLKYIIEGFKCISSGESGYNELSHYELSIVNLSDASLGEKTYIIDKNAESFIVDMEELSASSISISMKAVSNDITKRNDSAFSSPMTHRVGVRLEEVPNSVVSFSDEAVDGAYTRSQFANPGIIISAQQSTYDPAVATTGKYELDAYIGSDEKRTVHLSESGLMEGNLALGEMQLPIDEKYAGMYLYVRLRAVSDSAISSLWSAEDDIAGSIDGWVSYHIPALMLDSVDVSIYNLTSVYSSYLSADWKCVYNGADTTTGKTAHFGIGWNGAPEISSYSFEITPLDAAQMISFGSVSLSGYNESDALVTSYKVLYDEEDGKFKVYRELSPTIFTECSSDYALEADDYPHFDGLGVDEAAFVLKDYSVIIELNALSSMKVKLNPILVCKRGDDQSISYKLLIPDSYLLMQVQKLTECVEIKGIVESEHLVAPNYLWTVTHEIDK